MICAVIDGGEQMEVDALGRKISESAKIAPQPGTDVTVTLDLDLQRAAERAMSGHRGAVVALDPATGDILALVSAPSFDLNARGATALGVQPRGARQLSARLGLQDHHRRRRPGDRQNSPGHLFYL